MESESTIAIGLIPCSDSHAASLQVTFLAKVKGGEAVPETALAKLFRSVKHGSIPVVSAQGPLAWRLLARMKGEIPPDSEGRSFFGNFHGNEALTIVLNWGPGALVKEPPAPAPAKTNYPFNSKG